MISRNNQNRRRSLTHQLHAKCHVVGVIGTVDGEIAGMNDQIRLLCLKPGQQRRPIAVEMRLGRAKVGICDLDDLHGQNSDAWDEGNLPHRLRALIEAELVRRVTALSSSFPFLSSNCYEAPLVMVLWACANFCGHPDVDQAS